MTRTVHIGGVECIVEQVPIESIAAWRSERGLVPVRRVEILQRDTRLVGVLYWPAGKMKKEEHVE